MAKQITEAQQTFEDEVITLCHAVAEGGKQGTSLREREIAGRSVFKSEASYDAHHLRIASTLMLAFMAANPRDDLTDAEKVAHKVREMNEVRNPLRYLNYARDDLREAGKLSTATGDDTHGRVVPSVKPQNNGATWSELKAKKAPKYLELALTAIGKIPKGKATPGAIGDILAAMVATGFDVDAINSTSAVESEA